MEFTSAREYEKFHTGSLEEADFATKERYRRSSSESDPFDVLASQDLACKGSITQAPVSEIASTYTGPVKGHVARRFGDRKSRAATGRGLPKKSGGGGAFTWGRPGCELYEKKKTLTIDDPDYDPLSDPNIVFDSVAIEPSVDELCTLIDTATREYFNNASIEDIFEYVVSLGLLTMKVHVVESFVEIGLEAKKEYRELISKAILYFVDNQYFSVYDVASGFSNLLDRANELILDTPEIVNILGKFIARADLEKCLPDKFIEIEIKNATSALTYNIMMTSYGLRKDKISVRKCWGECGGFMETALLSEKIRDILKEFLLTSDTAEVARCIRELDVPHYHHEIVYEAILIAMENYKNDLVANSMIWLLQHLYTKECIISCDQMVSGHCRIYSNLDDISLDIPHAYEIVQKIVYKSAQKKLISDRLKLMCPNKTRKRFSSESDIHEVHDIDIKPRARLCSTGLCSSGLDSLPEMDDLKI